MPTLLKNMKIRIILTLMLISHAANSLACSGGFSFQFKKFTKDSSYTNIEDYLNKEYGENGWKNENDLFTLKLPKTAENSAVIPITIGAKNNNLTGGMYSELKLYVVEYIYVIDNEKYSKEYLPSVYHVDDLSKNSNKAFNFKDITHQEKRINNIANFKFTELSLPHVSTRLNLTQATRAKVFAVFVPRNKSELVKVIVQDNDIYTKHPCINVYYVRGKWPKGLRQEHRYE